MAGLIITLISVKGVCGSSSRWQTLDDFGAHMYPLVLPAYPCTKLLNTTGAIGCEASGPSISGTLRHVRSIRELDDFARAPASHTILVLPFRLFAHHDTLGAIDHAHERSGVGGIGVLVLAPDTNDLPLEFSPELANPQQQTGMYNATFTAWNSNGTGASHTFSRFPIFMVGKSASADLLEKCRQYENTTATYPRWAAKLTLTMQAQSNSIECLAASTCSPLTAQSVVAVISPTSLSTPSAADSGGILAAAVMDSTSFFHGDWNTRDDQLSPGGGAEIAGAVATVAAARAVFKVRHRLQIPIYFAIFSAETWGRVGSRRFMSHPPKGLNVSAIKYAIGVGGISNVTSPKELYLHVDQYGPQKVSSKALTSLLTDPQAGVQGLSKASPHPGRIPPNPVETVAKLTDFEATSAVIAGHNAAFDNRYFHSILDGSNNARSDVVCNLATTLARSLVVLSAGADSTVDPEFLSTISADQKFVDQLLDCTLNDFGCPLANHILESRGERSVDGFAPHYVLVRRNPQQTSPLEAFFHDLLANETAGHRGGPCRNSQDCADAGPAPDIVNGESRMCVMGTCLVTGARFHDAYSSALTFDAASSQWIVDSAQAASDCDPVWAESNWHSDLGVTLFLQGDPSAERHVLYVGVAVLAVSLALVAGWR